MLPSLYEKTSSLLLLSVSLDPINKISLSAPKDNPLSTLIFLGNEYTNRLASSLSILYNDGRFSVSVPKT